MNSKLSLPRWEPPRQQCSISIVMAILLHVPLWQKVGCEKQWIRNLHEHVWKHLFKTPAYTEILSNTIDDRRVVRKHHQKRCSCDLFFQNLEAPQHCWTIAPLNHPQNHPSKTPHRLGGKDLVQLIQSHVHWPQRAGYRCGSWWVFVLVFGWDDTWLFDGSEPVEVFDSLYHGLYHDIPWFYNVLYIPDFCRVSSINSRIPIGVALIEKASLISLLL